MDRLKITLTALCAAILCACVTQPKVELSDFNTEIYTPKYASGFSIKTLPDSTATLIQISKPWQGAVDKPQNILILDQKTTPPENFVGATLHAPAQRIICLSSSNIAMIDAVALSDRIVGVSGIQYISNPTVIESYNNGRTLDIGYGTALNFEAIVALHPDIVLLYGVSGEEPSVTSKLSELGIQYIYIGDYAEESPLGKAEWMVALGEICGVRKEAIMQFEKVDTQYTVLRDSLSTSITKPRVMLNTPYRDVWYMPSTKSYMVQLLHDAGGEYLYPENNTDSSQPISLEQAYTLVSQADIWLNMGAVTRTKADLKSQNPIFAEMDVVSRGELYNTTARTTPSGGSDFWESGVVRPDIILADLIKILHPEHAFEHELYYYEKLK